MGCCATRTRPPGKKPLSAAVKRKALSKTASELPPNATRWSMRSMAKAAGISQWAEAELKPHLDEAVKAPTVSETSVHRGNEETYTRAAASVLRGRACGGVHTTR
jgi:hypothetical protein